MTDEATRVAPHDARARFDRWMAGMWRTVGGFSVRTKILGIVLAMTVVLGLVFTWQVRTVLTGVLMAELDNRGQSVVSDLAARTSEPILLNDTYGVFELLNDTVTSHAKLTRQRWLERMTVVPSAFRADRSCFSSSVAARGSSV